MTPTRLEVTESLRAVDREEIDRILASPADALDRPDVIAVPPPPAAEAESPFASDTLQDTLRAQLEDELDHAGLEEGEEEERVTPAPPATPPIVAEPVKEHHPARWGGV